jgi:ACS family allantoate permease-like MFS transporter
VILTVLATIDLYAIRWLDVKENRRRDERKAELGDDYMVEKHHGFLGLMDWENLEFKYSL